MAVSVEHDFTCINLFGKKWCSDLAVQNLIIITDKRDLHSETGLVGWDIIGCTGGKVWSGNNVKTIIDKNRYTLI